MDLLQLYGRRWPGQKAMAANWTYYLKKGIPWISNRDWRWLLRAEENTQLTLTVDCILLIPFQMLHIPSAVYGLMVYDGISIYFLYVY